MADVPPQPVEHPPDAPVGAGFDFTDPNSPLAKYYLRTAQVVAVGFVGLIFVVATAFPLWHTDVWGHLRYGKWMADHRAIPDREPFCPWWDARQPFTQFYTLSQLAMYGAYAAGERIAGGDDLNQMAGGVELLRGLHGLLTAARFAVLLFVFVRLGGSWPVALLGAVAVGLLDLSNLAVFRPQTFGQFLFAVLLLPLSRPVLSRRALVLVPLLMVVWANTHGSFIVALGLLGVVLAGRVVETGGVRAAWADPQVRRLAVAAAAGFVAVGVLNPYGFELYKRTLDLSKHPSLISAVGEWQPVAFVWARGWHWVFMLSLLVAVGTQLVARVPLSPGRLLALFVFGVAVALQNRFVIWWAMVLPWALVPQWAEIAGRREWPASVPSFRKTILAGVLGVAVLMWSGPAGWLTAGKPMPVGRAASAGTPWQVARELARGEVAESDRVPGLAETLKANYPGGRFAGSILATPMQGDYLMWALAPDVPVTYAHIHLFPPEFWEELGVVGQGRPGWWDVLEKYRVNLLVVEAEYAPRLREELRKTKTWRVLVDETGDARKPEPLNRQFIAIRVRPL